MNHINGQEECSKCKAHEVLYKSIEDETYICSSCVIKTEKERRRKERQQQKQKAKKYGDDPYGYQKNYFHSDKGKQKLEEAKTRYYQKKKKEKEKVKTAENLFIPIITKKRTKQTKGKSNTPTTALSPSMTETSETALQ